MYPVTIAHFLSAKEHPWDTPENAPSTSTVNADVPSPPPTNSDQTPYVNQTTPQSANAYNRTINPARVPGPYHFSGASSKENHASRYNSSSGLTSINSARKKLMIVSRKQGRYRIRGSCSYHVKTWMGGVGTYSAAVLVKDLDSLAAREIFVGRRPCHTFWRSSRVISSSSVEEKVSAGCGDWDMGPDSGGDCSD